MAPDTIACDVVASGRFASLAAVHAEAFCRIAANCRNAAWQLGGWSRSLPRTR